MYKVYDFYLHYTYINVYIHVKHVKRDSHANYSMN